MAYTLPDKPSIAVLPFDNLSGDPAQDYLGDGITENTIAVLATSPDLFVIARNSSFAYKGKAVQVQEVAERFGVRYVLEGSVQRAGDWLRVTAQLVNAIDGQHLWAERYDRELDNLFALQDEIAQEILVAMDVKLTMGSDANLFWERTKDLETYRLVV
jgi:TolB-like protein